MDSISYFLVNACVGALCQTYVVAKDLPTVQCQSGAGVFKLSEFYREHLHEGEIKIIRWMCVPALGTKDDR